MSSTNVHSENSKSTASIAGSAFDVTEETLEIPPEAQVFKEIPSYVEEQGNIEIPVGEGFVTDKNILVKKDGTTLNMKNPNTYANLKAKRSRKMQGKPEVETGR